MENIGAWHWQLLFLKFLEIDAHKVGVSFEFLITRHTDSVFGGVVQKFVDEVASIWVEALREDQISLKDFLKHGVVVFTLERGLTDMKLIDHAARSPKVGESARIVSIKHFRGNV